MSAEEVIKVYLNTVLSMTEVMQKNNLLDLTKGPLREAIDTATEETIREAYLDKRQELESFLIIENSKKTPREIELTFQLVYKEELEGQRDNKDECHR